MTQICFFHSPPHAIHLDMLKDTRRAQFRAALAIAVAAQAPDAGDARAQRVVGFAAAQWSAQVMTRTCEQAGVELAIGREPRTRAIAAERRTDRIDETDFACAVGVTPAASCFG